jgi:hypothetical protein
MSPLKAVPFWTWYEPAGSGGRRRARGIPPPALSSYPSRIAGRRRTPIRPPPMPVRGADAWPQPAQQASRRCCRGVTVQWGSSRWLWTLFM